MNERGCTQARDGVGARAHACVRAPWASALSGASAPDRIATPEEGWAESDDKDKRQAFTQSLAEQSN